MLISWFGNLMVLLGSYWIPAAFYTIVDIFKPQIFYQYKVQAEAAQVTLNYKVLYNLVTRVLTNQVTQVLIGSQLAWIFRYKDINTTWPLEQVPSVHT